MYNSTIEKNLKKDENLKIKYNLKHPSYSYVLELDDMKKRSENNLILGCIIILIFAFIWFHEVRKIKF